MAKKRLPITAAKDVAQKYGLSRVLLIAVSDDYEVTYTVSYGKTKKDCRLAASDIAKLRAVLEAQPTSFEEAKKAAENPSSRKAWEQETVEELWKGLSRSARSVLRIITNGGKRGVSSIDLCKELDKNSDGIKRIFADISSRANVLKRKSPIEQVVDTTEDIIWLEKRWTLDPDFKLKLSDVVLGELKKLLGATNIDADADAHDIISSGLKRLLG